MPRKGGFRREGSRGRFRYVDARGNRVTDEEKLERIKSLVIPPAWKEVWIAGTAASKLQATGVDAVGITTLRKRHVRVRGHRIAFDFQGKHKSVVRTTLVDDELAEAIRELLALPRGGRLFRYEWDEGFVCADGSEAEQLRPGSPR